MKTKLLVIIMLASLLAGMLAILPIRPAAAAGNATLSISPTTTTAAPGDVNSFFDVYLDIDTDTGLFGFDINITWADNTLITLDYLTSNSSTTPLLDAVWGSGGWIQMISESGGGGGGGYLRIVALSTHIASTTGTHRLIAMHFQIKKGCNFLLQTAIAIDRNLAKLSDINYTPITVTAYNDALFKITARTPGLAFVKYEPDGHPYEYGKIFEVRVYVNEICATLKDYNLVIEYEAELLTLTGVGWAGSVLGGDGDETFTESTKGTINIVDPGVVGPTTYSVLGDGFLFTLTFKIEFNNVDAEHIWRTNNQDPLHAFIKFTAPNSLSFNEGDWTSGITMPADLDITVNLIRGDTDCNGKVDVFDLRCIAGYYDKKSTDPEWTDPINCSKYNLVSSDNTIDVFDLVAASTNFNYGV